ncbi:hypothetical protein V493_00636 [Pseudogymnoascus sp. VKM F-4281 (FW-2241)]|nr:hypothetical protein V493_00636 [Pseudogymnoascus sp. VKM F-4281 (FW-2241)]
MFRRTILPFALFAAAVTASARIGPIPWYSECLPGAAASTPVTTPATTTKRNSVDVPFDGSGQLEKPRQASASVSQIWRPKMANPNSKFWAWYLLTSADTTSFRSTGSTQMGLLEIVTHFAKGEAEAPGIFVVNGSTNIALENVNTYNSQNTHELTIVGSGRTAYIYMGDAWSKGSAASNYIWLPMTTGVVSTPKTKKQYKAEHGLFTGRAAVTDCSDCISKRAVHNIRSGSEVTFHNVTGSGLREWVSSNYTMNDPTASEAYIVVNNEPGATNLSQLNSGAGHHRTVTVELALRSGDVNTGIFGASGAVDFEVFLDGIELHAD